jgi:hypothetical protein
MTTTAEPINLSTVRSFEVVFRSAKSRDPDMSYFAPRNHVIPIFCGAKYDFFFRTILSPVFLGGRSHT